MVYTISWNPKNCCQLYTDKWFTPLNQKSKCMPSIAIHFSLRCRCLQLIYDNVLIWQKIFGLSQLKLQCFKFDHYDTVDKVLGIVDKPENKISKYQRIAKSKCRFPLLRKSDKMSTKNYSMNRVEIFRLDKKTILNLDEYIKQNLQFFF